jgi:hypothetical protein
LTDLCQDLRIYSFLACLRDPTTTHFALTPPHYQVFSVIAASDDVQRPARIALRHTGHPLFHEQEAKDAKAREVYEEEAKHLDRIELLLEINQSYSSMH